jgi:hypothetical protein
MLSVMTHRGRISLAVGLSILVVGACGGSESSTSTTTTQPTNATLVGTLPPAVTAPPVVTTAATTVPVVPPTEPTTTIPPTTVTLTVPPSTAPATTVDPATELILSAVGLGPHPFGTGPVELLDDLNGRFGLPGTDEVTTFVTNNGEYITEDGCCGFIAAAGREICWPNGMCVTFGGQTTESLGFVGWFYQGDEFASLRSAAGVTLGSRWSNFLTAMTVLPGGCYTTGSGATNDGITLDVIGGDFATVAEDGSFTTLLPAPEEVTVIAMSSGEHIYDLEGDC